MLTNHAANKFLTGRSFRLVRALSGGVVAAVLFSGIFFSLPSLALAQQRVIVEKSTGNVVDVGDSTLQYDTRYFDNLDYHVSPISAGANVRKYMRDASGAIVLRPKDELTKNFDDEWRSALVLRIKDARLAPDLTALLLDIVKNIRR